MKALSRRLALAAQTLSLAALGPLQAHAARPLITDDARIVDPKACQLETWVRRNVDSTEFWALPACNPTGNVELTFGGAMTRELGSLHNTDVQVQAKTIFRKLEPDGWGFGLAVGNLRHPGIQPHRDFVANTYGYVPVSLSFAHDKVVVHANLGTVRPEQARTHQVAWGLGAELRLNERVILIPEVFSQTGGRPLFQTGLRYWVVLERMQIDATYGDRIGTSNGERWFSIGMRLLSPAFLP